MNHLEFAEQKAKDSSVFAAISWQKATSSSSLTCEALEAASPARYTLSDIDGTWFVALETEDRWLSESIEADLMHSGDSLEELLEEELIDMGLAVAAVTTQHFRDERMHYVFRSPLPKDVSPEQIALWLLAYEATFRDLGDMSTSES